MPIQIQYQPDPTLTGPAAYDVGRAEGLRQQQEDELRRAQFAESQRQFDVSQFLGADFRNRQLSENQRQFDTQFGEGARQFDARLGQGQEQFEGEMTLRQAALEEERQAAEFNRQIAAQRDRLARFGILDRQQDRAAELAALDIRGQYGLAGDAMGYEARLAAEQMQQSGMDARQGQQIAGQFGLQWQQQAARQMQADWMNIQKALPKLDPQEREELIQKFHDKWQNANVPMPVEMPQPELPEWMDPNAQWDKANAWAADEAAKGNKIFLVPDENGMPSIMRGSPSYPQTPEGMKQQHEFELEKEQGKNVTKQQEAEQAKQDAEEARKQKAADADIARKIKIYDAQFEARRKALEGMAPDPKNYMKPGPATAEGKGTMVLDEERFNKAYDKWESAYDTFVSQYSGQGEAPRMPDMYQGGGSAQGGSITVNSQAELNAVLADPKIPAGTIIVWGPTGKSRAK